MNSLFERILRHKEFEDRPLILVDVGASGGLPEKWREIAPYSICIAFDADTRDFNISEETDRNYRKLYTLNRLVADKTKDEVDFFLTRSPYCSSSLHPHHVALKPWAFSSLFDVENKVKMPAVDLNSSLAAIGITHIDWYKSDSQGTDLRIFRALSKQIIDRVLVCEFEPGIIDAYLSEDKLHTLMKYMDEKPFWVTSMKIQGSQRINEDQLRTLNAVQRKYIDSFLKMAPGWCEISYMNNFESGEFALREYLLGWIFASINKEHGFALQIASTGLSKFRYSLFSEMENYSRKALFVGYPRLGLRVLSKVVGMFKRVIQ